jgi:hypothetical protein
MNSADEWPPIPMSWIWTLTIAVVAVFGGLWTPRETIEQLIMNREEGANFAAFVAGYTLPLTAGFGVIALLVRKGIHNEIPSAVALVGAAVILWLAGEAARLLGLGLLPDYTGLNVDLFDPSRALQGVLKAYFNAYGRSLMVCAFAIGCTLAIQVERWL